MSENYIVINGKRAELTEEQMKALGIEVKKDPFARVKYGEKYLAINSCGDVVTLKDIDSPSCYASFKVANYCTDKALMEQRALHETLNRLLWRYSMQHDGEEVRWSGVKPYRRVNYRIFYNHYTNVFDVVGNDIHHEEGAIYFANKETAEAAIEEVVKPFMEQHPEFKW